MLVIGIARAAVPESTPTFVAPGEEPPGFTHRRGMAVSRCNRDNAHARKRARHLLGQTVVAAIAMAELAVKSGTVREDLALIR